MITYIINLKQRVDRFQKCLQNLKEIKHTNNVKKFDAIDTFFDDELTQIECNRVNCALSHFSVLFDAYEKRYESVCILEDDFQPLRYELPFSRHISDVCRDLPHDWDVVFLGGNLYYNGTKPPVSPFSDKLNKLNYCVGMHSVLYSQDGIKKILDQIYKIDDLKFWIRKYTAVDVWYSEVIIPNVNSFIMKQHLFSQFASESDIEGVFVDYRKQLKNKELFWDQVLTATK